jgi:hypothetical protein
MIPRPVVEVEEEVYRYDDASNGAGPMWCAGSTCLARVGGRLFASGLETVADALPLSNCRWTLYERLPTGWVRVAADAEGRTREPAPIAALPKDRLLLSANPILTRQKTSGGGPARPELLEFRGRQPSLPPLRELPGWDGSPRFTEHSYRSLAVDPESQGVILFQNIDYSHAEWAYRDRRGRWAAHGQLVWPWGAEYDKPHAVRLCYPDVALRGRAVYFFGVSDVEEPYQAWREYKHQVTGRGWDYDFRRLFFTWTPDITREPFKPWIEVASRDKTCGWLWPCDLHVGDEGRVHIVWSERALDERLRERFFPNARQSHSLHYAVLRDGKILHRVALTESTEDHPGLVGSRARFHVAPRGRLFVSFHVSGRETDGRSVSENRVLEIGRDGTPGPMARIPFTKPFYNWFTDTPRAGSPPSRNLEFLGEREGETRTIAYARVRIE